MWKRICTYMHRLVACFTHPYDQPEITPADRYVFRWPEQLDNNVYPRHNPTIDNKR